jgi:hypothetical protein
VRPVGRSRIGRFVASLIAVCALTSPASALARQQFRPRIGPAMGIVPPLGHREIASGPSVPVVYHGGTVMRGVTIHTIFWAPSGFRFSGSPGAGVPGYEPMVQQFLADSAHDSGTAGNGYSVLTQYPQRGGAGSYAISFSAATDSIDDSDPYPPLSKQCPSPAGVATCVTDLQLRQEIDKVIQAHDPAGRGLHDIWFIFLPPNVDTCIAVGSCGTTAYAGYHSLLNLGRGPTIYAVIPDPLIEFTPPQGQDPQGNPEAESTIDTVAHEAVEAITDPSGTGWMDPNGFEVADKCENPEIGTPLGFAANGAPYNQLINGHQYLIQAMWSNTVRGCVQGSTAPGTLPPQTVALTQFSPAVSGNTGVRRAGIPVAVGLGRAGHLVALALGRTRADGSWGPLLLRSESGGLRGLGDDRDQLAIMFNSRLIKPDLIQTGDGGNPFTESGWTGWYDLDHGYSVRSRSVLLAPCSQTGVLSLRVASALTAPPVDQCDSESDISTVQTRQLTGATGLEMSSEDNRAPAPDNRDGALVKLTVRLGEPGSVSSVGNSQILFNPSGFPACTADLRAQSVSCSGLVPHARYTLTRSRGRAVARARASRRGLAAFARFPGMASAIRGGDVVTLTNGAGRVLTTLHVSHLRVDIRGEQTAISGGTCEPGEYYGKPLQKLPISQAIGVGVAGTGTVCSSRGRAAGFPTDDIAQTDDRSGGQTRTEVPTIERTTPIDGETLYGAFIAIARGGRPGANGSTINDGSPVALTITRASSGRTVFRARNVNTNAGVAIRGLLPGAYLASWVLRDAAGDTRTVRTGFVEAP